jgi:hypothetical protein
VMITVSRMFGGVSLFRRDQEQSVRVLYDDWLPRWTGAVGGGSRRSHGHGRLRHVEVHVQSVLGGTRKMRAWDSFHVAKTIFSI